MDKELLKTLLQSQQEAYKSATGILVNQFNNKIEQLESKVSELQRSLEFSQREIVELVGEKNRLVSETKEDSKRLAELSNNSEVLRARIVDLENRVNYQEDYSRKNNLRISGVAEREGGETWEQAALSVKSLLENKLELPPLRIEQAHRTGQSRDNKPRQIVARFASYADRDAVLRNASKLKGTRIYVNEDLCPASREIIKEQLPFLHQAKQQGKIAYFRHTKLIIKERNQATRTQDAGRSADEGGDALPVVTNQGASTQHGVPDSEDHRGSPARVPQDLVGAAIGDGSNGSPNSYATRARAAASTSTRAHAKGKKK